jgi:phage shock protein C
MQKLRRSQYDRVFGGICGGIAAYTSTDSTIWRLLFIILFFSPFPIILFYLLSWIIIPKYNTI